MYFDCYYRQNVQFTYIASLVYIVQITFSISQSTSRRSSIFKAPGISKASNVTDFEQFMNEQVTLVLI